MTLPGETHLHWAADAQLLRPACLAKPYDMLPCEWQGIGHVNTNVAAITP